MEIIANYINGALVAPQGGEYIDNYEPATGKVYGKIPRSQADDVAAAVQAAEAAFPSWSALSMQERSRYLLKISEAIDAKLGHLAQAESRDNGKPIKLAEAVDIPRARDNFAFFATAILHQEDEFHNMGEKGFNYTLRQPIGTVACISPWNLPLYLFTWKIAPALASGNCVVAKPSEVTPFTAFLLSQICIEVGLPAGVLNIVHGLGAETGQAMVEHPKVKAISFTGGTATGARIASIAAPKFKKLSLELGGKNPNIIFADCDLERAINISARAAFANQGQICLCGSRIFIERSIYEDFKKGFLQRVAGLKVGPPQEADSRMGALVSKEHLEKVFSYIQLAQEEGGKILAGGNKVNLPAPYDQGYYLEPTVIEGLAFNCRTNQEEIFGPVVTLTPFDSEEEVLMMANSTEYGLACTIFTENLNKAHRVAKEIHSGIVWINDWLVRDLRTPFGGMKNSGVGREGGFEALKFFTEAKNVCVNY
ncbi:MAG: 2-hydroxymuconic semialdehyde dehydrogenase [Bacteroidetes bacterium]|nr:MAG: 2-hydroxymuconic semialdehyde dehydrogenase [Bacteroidota bacterium]